MEEKNGNKEKKHLYRVFTEQISGIFLPIINYLTAASLLKSVIVLLAGFGVMDTVGGVYKVFYAVSDGFFYFLPFFLWRSPSHRLCTHMDTKEKDHPISAAGEPTRKPTGTFYFGRYDHSLNVKASETQVFALSDAQLIAFETKKASDSLKKVNPDAFFLFFLISKDKRR